MGKALDLTGQKFGKLTAIKIVDTDKNYNKIWECQCDCGNTCTALAKELKSGHKKSCGCSFTIDRANDLTGQRFRRLTVIERDWNKGNKKGSYWKCRCDCGNEKTISNAALRNGRTQSCGCLNKEINSQPKEIADMIGRKFGYLTVIERAGTHITVGGQKKVLWHCKCDCGNETDVTSQGLKSGHTKSCGCIPTKPKGSGLIDLVEKRFGKLTVIKRDEDYTYETNGKIINTPRWKCICDCGNVVVVQGGNLRNGLTTNCGCDRVNSKGEELVAEFLIKNNIKYIREYSFDDLRNKSGNLLRFDFAILNDDENIVMLIEYQGEQHYKDCGDYGLYQRKYSDPMKRKYCQSHNIPLYEIKYDDGLEDIFNNLLNEIKKL